MERRCPGGICVELITYSIDPELCDGCHACVKVCPQDVIAGDKKQTHTIDTAGCIKCGACLSACTRDAISRK